MKNSRSTSHVACKAGQYKMGVDRGGRTGGVEERRNVCYNNPLTECTFAKSAAASRHKLGIGQYTLSIFNC